MGFSRKFDRVLAQTGYIGSNGQPRQGFLTSESIISRENAFRFQSVFTNSALGADGVFEAGGAPFAIFKDSSQRQLNDDEAFQIQEAAWNFGLAPLLWIVSPTHVHLYDAFTRGDRDGSAPFASFALDSSQQIADLNRLCGRLAADTGAFWQSEFARKIDRSRRVDRLLLSDLKYLQGELLSSGLRIELAQSIIGRCIFAQYLIDKNILNAEQLERLFGTSQLADILMRKTLTFRLFEWLRAKFNGDLFPLKQPAYEQRQVKRSHLALLARFFGHGGLADPQMRLFRYKFDAIPVDLISSIYEQFAQSYADDSAKKQGLHYTPIELVNLVLDPVFEGLNSDAKVLDPACGSGVFLVESFRRLVWKKSRHHGSVTREIIRDVLYGQLYGVDVNPAALGITAFSLCLAALEMDPAPTRDLRGLRFKNLIGNTLVHQSIFEDLPAPLRRVRFDAIVGNPPWTFTPNAENDDRIGYLRRTGRRTAKRSPDQAFLWRARDDLSHSKTRLAFLVHAPPLFSTDADSMTARSEILKALAPVSIVNLSRLRKDGLFPTASGAAAIVFSGCGQVQDPAKALLGSISWSPEFGQRGTFQISPSDFSQVSLTRLISTPEIFKVAVLGTVRDTWLVERMIQEFPSLDECLDDLGIARRGQRSQGFQVGGAKGKIGAADLQGRKYLSAKSFTPFRIDESALEVFNFSHLYRRYADSVYRGPLLLCPKGNFDSGLVRGRYTAAIHEKDLLYNESVYGISFYGCNPKLAPVLNAILHSSLTAYQLIFVGGPIGIERPTVEPSHLLSVRVPSIDMLSGVAAEALVDIESRLASMDLNDARHLLPELDDLVYDLYGLSRDERTLVDSFMERSGLWYFENKTERADAALPPKKHELNKYAATVAKTIGAFLSARGRAVHDAYGVQSRSLLSRSGMVVMRFELGSERTGQAGFELAPNMPLDKLLDHLEKHLRAPVAPYLHEQRVLRLYADKSLYILKPADARYWTRTAALNDADRILADHLRGVPVAQA